jgi:hypothetical protein
MNPGACILDAFGQGIEGKITIAFLRKMRYDVTDLNEVKNIEPENVMQL